MRLSPHFALGVTYGAELERAQEEYDRVLDEQREQSSDIGLLGRPLFARPRALIADHTRQDSEPDALGQGFRLQPPSPKGFR